MNIDPTMVNQFLDKLQYPIGKAQIVRFAKERKANEQVMSLIEKLPDNLTFNSAEEIKSKVASLKNVTSSAVKQDR